MIPTLKNGTCGASLRTCSLIIAWIQELSSIIGLLTFFLYGNPFLHLVVETYKRDRGFKEGLYWPTVFLLGLSIIIYLLLLIGIYTRNYKLIVPYLIFTGLIIVLIILSMIPAYAAIFHNRAFIQTFFVCLFSGAFYSYFLAVLYAYCMEIKTQALNN